MKAASWHGRLALHYGPLHMYDLQDMDICTYTRAVLKGFGVVCLITAALWCVSVMVTSTLFGIYFWLAWGFNLWAIREDVFAACAWFLPITALMIGALAAWYYAAKVISEWRSQRRHDRIAREREAGFVEQAVDAHVNRYCFKLSFSDVPAARGLLVDTFDSRF